MKETDSYTKATIREVNKQQRELATGKQHRENLLHESIKEATEKAREAAGRTGQQTSRRTQIRKQQREQLTLRLQQKQRAT